LKGRDSIAQARRSETQERQAAARMAWTPAMNPE